MEIPDARAIRFAISYKSKLKMAHECARNGAGRQGRQMLAEAQIMDGAATALLGPDAWHELLDGELTSGPS